jgi:ATP-dependent Clp protease ATP-binding subunit ClpA
MDLGSWLRSLGLAQYEAAFRENAINEAILPKLTAEDLKDIGVTAVGHRRVLLDAIAALRGETPPNRENAPSAAPEPASEPNRVGGGLPEAQSTWRLTGGLFEYRELWAVVLKRFAEDVPACQVLGVGTADSRFEALRATTTPLIGRDEEIDLLIRRWGQANCGEGCVVLISGEPGIGKSRIAQTIVERLSNEPHTRLRYFCSPHHQDSAFYPSITQLERAANLRRNDTDEQRFNKLEKLLARGTNDLASFNGGSQS